MIHFHRSLFSFCYTFVLSGSAFASGELVVAGGHVTLGDGTTLNSPGGEITVEDGSIMTLEGNDTVVKGNRVIVRGDALLTGCGLIDAQLVIFGDVVADCGPESYLEITELGLVAGLERDGLLRATNGSEIRLTGSVTNNGLIELLEGSFLSITDGISFTNNGVVDLQDGTIGNMPDGFSFGGTVLTPAASERVQVLDKPQRHPTSGDWELTIYGIEGKSYSLTTNTTLDASGWSGVETRLADSFGPLTFSYPYDSQETSRFWQVNISDSPSP